MVYDLKTLFGARRRAASYGRALVQNTIDSAFYKLERLRPDSTHYLLNEDEMNDLGLLLLYAATFPNDAGLSLEVLKLNVLLFPNSFNTYDSYGEGLAKTGRISEAILMYRKSIELNPDNEEGRQALKRLDEGKKRE